jgi:C4-dicarboxylate-specific signal transduction histidine kinase
MEPETATPLLALSALTSLASLVVIVVAASRWSGKLDAKADTLRDALTTGMAKIDARLESHARRLDHHHEQITLLKGIEEGRRIERERRDRE